MDFGFLVGNTYRFDLSDSSNAPGPLRFSTTADTAMPASITPYTTGVTVVGTEGTPGAYVQILISNATPSLFLYSDETGIDTSLIGAALEIPQVRNQEYSGSEDLASATAASIVKSASYFSTAAAETATLAAGMFEGFIKTFCLNPPPPPLSSVTITGTGGTFSCSATTLEIGQRITIAGTLGGTGSITGYSDPTTYYIIATNGSTTFTLSASLGGVAITTTAGTPTGLTYTPLVGTMVITVTDAGWKSSGTGTITFDAAGEACTLQYINSKWFCIGNNGAAFA
jgi:hypothetical protein